MKGSKDLEKTKEQVARFTHAMAANKMDQSEVAKSLGIERQNVNNWMRRGIPNDKIFMVAKLLQVDAQWLAHGTTDDPSAHRTLQPIAEHPNLYKASTAHSPKKDIMNTLMDGLTETQKDELIRIAEKWAAQNREIMTELSRPAKNNSAL